jgi:P4 family phage/plasmid primase-like protien
MGDIYVPNILKKFKLRFVKLNGKAPIEPDWNNTNNYAHDDDEFLSHLSSTNGNYGILCGINNLVVIDVDDLRLDDFVRTNLPATLTIRTGSGKFHYYYFCEEIVNKDLNKNGIHWAEIRGENRQVVGPNSIHPNTKEKYEIVDEEVEIATITKKQRDDFIIKFDTEFDKNFDRFFSIISEHEILKDMFNGSDLDYTSRSEADLAFTSRLKGFGFTKEQVREIFNRSNRSKYFEKLKYPQYFEELWRKAFGDKQVIKERVSFYRSIAEKFMVYSPFYYDKNKIWWLWDDYKKRWEIVDEVDIMIRFDTFFNRDTEKSEEKSRILESLRKVGRKNKPKEIPNTWLQFKDKIVDIETGSEMEASPEFFVLNPIPWSLGNSEETPIIDKLFYEWVVKEDFQDETYVDTLYQTVAFTLLPVYAIHRIICLIGDGCNGKTSFTRMLEKFIGKYNATSSDMKILIESRFETAKLYKKLLCVLGEIDIGILNRTSLLKRLTGDDKIGFEIKRKTPFDDYNYAKIFIATNNLPETIDKTGGFYRRWLIIDFPNVFEEGKDVVDDIPNYEYENLARKCVRILKGLLKKGKFLNEGDVKFRKKKYETRSSSINQFVEEYCVKDGESFIIFSEFYEKYKEFLVSRRLRIATKLELSKVLRDAGYEMKVRRIKNEFGEITTAMCVLGIKFIDE